MFFLYMKKSIIIKLSLVKERSDSILNNLILVGRVVEDAKLITLETGVKVSNFVLAVQRPFKNEKDEYETDFIPVQLWHAAADIAYDYCTKGSIIGVKGRLVSRNVEIADKKIRTIEVVGERISFISTNKKQEAE